MYGDGLRQLKLGERSARPQGALHQRDSSTDELLLAWGAGISRLEIERGRYMLPLWLVDLYTALRERAPQLVDRAIWVVAFAALALTLLIGQRVRRDAQILGLLPRQLLRRWWADWQGPLPPAAERHLPEWERTIRARLLDRGEVGPGDLAAVPRPLRGAVLARYEQTCRDRQALTLDGRRLRLDTHRWIARWQVHWRDLTEFAAQYRTFNAGVNRKADEAVAMFEEGIGSTRRSEAKSEYGRGYLVDVELENRSLPRIYPLILVGDAPSIDVQANVVHALMNELYERSSVVLVVPLPSTIGKPGELRETFRRRNPRRDIVVLEPGDIVDMLMAATPAVELERRILNRLDLSALRPFVTIGPVEQQFFGREQEIRTIIQNAGRMSFAIIGNRKIGKTSLLLKVRGELALREDIQPLFFRYEAYSGIEAFLADVGKKAEMPLPTLTMAGFGEVMRELKRHGRTPLLLIDEADALVKEDRLAGETLVRTFRALAEEQQCHFTFCGSSSLPHALDDGVSFYNNFLNPIQLGYLPRRTADEVLTRPLEYELRMELERRDELLALAYELSSGHPNVVQLIGQELFERAQQENERVIRYANLEALRNSTKFAKSYLHMIWGLLALGFDADSSEDDEYERMTAGERRDVLLDRLITLVMPAEGATLDQIEALVAEHLELYSTQLNRMAVYRALRQLEIYSLLHQDGQVYHFTPGAFHAVLHSNQPVERLAMSAVEALAEQHQSILRGRQ
jgi:hypothetical protein